MPVTLACGLGVAPGPVWECAGPVSTAMCLWDRAQRTGRRPRGALWGSGRRVRAAAGCWAWPVAVCVAAGCSAWPACTSGGGGRGGRAARVGPCRALPVGPLVLCAQLGEAPSMVCVAVCPSGTRLCHRV